MHTRPGLVFKASLLSILGVAVLGSTYRIISQGDESFYDPIIDVKATLEKLYVQELDAEKLKKMQQGAITGMLEALGDPYTLYVPPDEAAGFNKDLTGEYVGIGAQVQVLDGLLTIISPLEDSPAYRAGIMAQDKVLQINGETTAGLNVEECVEKLMGQEGTSVELLIRRDGKEIPYSIVREKIKTLAVKGLHRDETDPSSWLYTIDPKEKLGYIRLTQFTPGCAQEVAKALESLGASKGELKGLILDVRFNPGGMLTDAIDIADFFLKDGVIVSTKGRVHPEQVARAKAEGTLPEFPIVVLINGQSASASEILAGAIVENNRGIALGNRTYGKGSVQTVRPVESDGGELKITEQGYYLPSGKSITRRDDSASWGVDPSEGFYVPMTDEETLAMLRARRDEEILRGPGARAGGESGEPADAAEKDAKAPKEPARWDDPSWIVGHLKDPQLGAALTALQGKVRTGAWTPTGKPALAGEALAVGELTRLRKGRDQLTRELVRLDKRVEALENGLGGEKAPKEEHLWSQSVDLTGGSMKIFDPEGNLVTTLRITGNDLERWLVDADVKKDEKAEHPPEIIAPEGIEPAKEK